MPKGQCHCGAVTYEFSGEATHQALCHCADCRRHSGAPMVAWALIPNDQLAIAGETREYASSEHGRRLFCARCGTSLFYTNATIFPNATDIQFATLDDPDVLVPQAQIQTADRIGWMDRLGDMPQFERFPGVREQEG
ncbi:MAG: GFA family protein [Sphingomicrobium sp.]